MTVRERARSSLLADFSSLFQTVITYRMPMTVDEAIVFHKPFGDELYYCCPRCRNILDRDFMAYCSGCGQCLNWDQYRKIKILHHKFRK